MKGLYFSLILFHFLWVSLPILKSDTYLEELVEKNLFQTPSDSVKRIEALTFGLSREMESYFDSISRGTMTRKQVSDKLKNSHLKAIEKWTKELNQLKTLLEILKERAYTSQNEEPSAQRPFKERLIWMENQRYLERGDSLIQLRDNYQDRLEEFKKGVHKAQTTLGMAVDSTPQSEEKTLLNSAEKSLENAPQNHPDGEHFQEGEKAARFGDFPRAIELFQKARKENPFFVDAYANEGLCHYRLGNFASSSELIQLTLKLNPNHNLGQKIGLKLKELGF